MYRLRTSSLPSKTFSMFLRDVLLSKNFLSGPKICNLSRSDLQRGRGVTRPLGASRLGTHRWTYSTGSGMLLVSRRRGCQIIINVTPAGITQKSRLIWAELLLFVKWLWERKEKTLLGDWSVVLLLIDQLHIFGTFLCSDGPVASELRNLDVLLLLLLLLWRNTTFSPNGK